MEDKLIKLKSLSKKWYPNAPKKFTSKLHVNPVHQIVFGETTIDCLGFLIESRYFENVLWRNFNQDASIYHIELILVLLNNDMSLLNFDATKLNELLIRSLNVNTNYRSLAIIVQFIATLSTFYSSSDTVTEIMKPMFDVTIWSGLTEHESLLGEYKSSFNSSMEHYNNSSGIEKAHLNLKINWISKLVNFDLEPLTSDKKLYIEKILNFLILGCSSKKFPYLKEFVKQTNIPSLVRALPSLNKYLLIVQSSHILSFFLHPEYSFESLQRIIFETHPEIETLNEFIGIPSKYSYSPVQLHAFLLHNFKKDQLDEILFKLAHIKDTNFLRANLDLSSLLASTVTDLIYKNDFLRETTLTEREVLDDESLIVFPLLSDNLITGTFSNLHSLLALEINSHLSGILSRITVDSNLGIKGTSKYFHNISSLKKVEFEKYDLTLNSSTSHEHIILIELIKPNKYSPYKRVQTHGLNLLRIGKIVQNQTIGKKTKVTVVCSGSSKVESFETRINYAVSLPTSLLHKVLHNLDSTIESTKNMEDFLQEPKIVAEVSLEHDVKKQKLNGHEEVRAAVNPTSDEIFQSIITKNVTAIKINPNSGLETLILRSINFLTNERTLIVASSQNYVNAFPHIEGLIRYGDSNYLSILRKKIETSIRLVAGLFDFKGDSKFKFDIRNLAYYENQIKLVWTNYLKQIKDASTLLTFPLNPTANYSKFQDIVNYYTRIVKAIYFLKQTTPVSDLILSSTKLGQVWAYLYNNNNVLMNFEDYVDLNNTQSVKNTFDNIFIINGEGYTFPAVMKNNSINLKRLVVVGGELVRLFPKSIVANNQPFEVRLDFADGGIYNGLSFNPGFKYVSQFIKVENQIQEIEYCVLLFQYMKLLGYLSICICVSNLVQQALLKEVLTARDVPEWPCIVVANKPSYDFDSFQYCVTSLHDSTDSARRYGRLGNYYVGVLNWTCLDLPKKDQLILTKGDSFSSKESSQNLYTITGKDHLQLYISQMKSRKHK